jgi:hypothetical protein
MNIFEREEISTEAALQGLRTLAAIAAAVSDPGALASIQAAAEAAADERAAADAATALARSERADADAKLRELAEADKNHLEHLERTNKELAQRDRDLREGIHNHEIAVVHFHGQRDEFLKEKAAHDAEKARMRRHLGAAA